MKLTVLSHSTGGIHRWQKNAICVFDRDYTVLVTTRSTVTKYLDTWNCSWLYILTTFPTEVFRSVSVLTQHANLYGILLRPFKCDCSTPLRQRERGREKERLRLILQHPKIHAAIKEHQWTSLINRNWAKRHGDPLCEASHTETSFTLVCHSASRHCSPTSPENIHHNIWANSH